MYFFNESEVASRFQWPATLCKEARDGDAIDYRAMLARLEHRRCHESTFSNYSPADSINTELRTGVVLRITIENLRGALA